MKCVQHEYEQKNYRSSSCIKYYLLVWQVWLKLCATTYSRHLLQPAKITQSNENERDLGSVLTLKTSPPTKQVISPQLQLDLNFNELEVVTGYLYVLFRWQQVPCWSRPRGRSKMFSDDLHFPQTYESLDTVTTARSISIYMRHPTQLHTGWNKILALIVRSVISCPKKNVTIIIQRMSLDVSFARYMPQLNGVKYLGILLRTRVGTLIVATIYLQLIQNRYMFRSFTVFQCSHQHCVQPVTSNVEVVGYL